MIRRGGRPPHDGAPAAHPGCKPFGSRPRAASTSAPVPGLQALQVPPRAASQVPHAGYMRTAVYPDGGAFSPYSASG